MRRVILGVVISFMMLWLIYFLNPMQTKEAEVNQGESLTRKDSTPKNGIKPASMPERSIATITVSEIKSFRSSFPNKDEIKSEIDKNPHAPPRSLINFAEAMGPLVEKALQNSDDATLLFDELQKCTLDDSVAHTARALCLSNAEKLAKVYPLLSEKVTNMRALTPPEVTNLLESKRLLKK